MSKEIDFTLMSSEGGIEQPQNCGFKSDLRCQLSQTSAQHKSHLFTSIVWILVIRDRF